MPIEVLPVNQETVFQAAHLKATYPIAYSDAFAAAAALQHKASLITGDKEFKSLANVLHLIWLSRE